MSDRESVMCWNLDFYFLCINIKMEITKVVFVYIMTCLLRNNSIIEF